MVQTTQTTVEVPQPQFIDIEIDRPVIMHRVGETPTELSVEKHSLLSDAGKNAVQSRCAIWRIITSVEQEAKAKVSERKEMCREGGD